MIDIKNAGRVACIFGGIVLAWNIAEWMSEQSYVATLSQCSESIVGESTLVVISEGERMLSCKASYSKDGADKVATLTAKLHRDLVNSAANGRRVNITITSFDQAKARFAASPRDWVDTTAKVLFFEFIGLLLLSRVKKIR